ncbi:nucleoside phosphate kinase, partial [Perkinsus sp. BL_2016]
MRLMNHYLSGFEDSSDFRVVRGPELRQQQLPMFMIHGNHDEPTGERNLSAADLLEAAGLVHYFGKHERIDEEILVKPMLLQKGSTKLALFGL